MAVGAGGRDHLHFRLLDAGMPQWKIVAGYYAFCAAFGALALVTSSRLYKLIALIVSGVLVLVVLWQAERRSQVTRRQGPHHLFSLRLGGSYYITRWPPMPSRSSHSANAITMPRTANPRQSSSQMQRPASATPSHQRGELEQKPGSSRIDTPGRPSRSRNKITGGQVSRSDGLGSMALATTNNRYSHSHMSCTPSAAMNLDRITLNVAGPAALPPSAPTPNIR